jgi:hypothetical protein
MHGLRRLITRFSRGGLHGKHVISIQSVNEVMPSVKDYIINEYNWYYERRAVIAIVTCNLSARNSKASRMQPRASDRATALCGNSKHGLGVA